MESKIHDLQRDIRLAINKSGLSLEIINLILESISREILQAEIYDILEKTEQKEENTDGLYKDYVGE